MKLYLEEQFPTYTEDLQAELKKVAQIVGKWTQEERDNFPPLASLFIYCVVFGLNYPTFLLLLMKNGLIDDELAPTEKGLQSGLVFTQEILPTEQEMKIVRNTLKTYMNPSVN
ncbi:hypothetical protein MVI27_09835 [Chryseobacterium salipaludis]|uniref:hypothetical protein n=1 Tax=Chryseobacterium TaxID=59732 RepID=UPI001FF3A722|nr:MULTISPECIES: hypothetical protein [Chryseobacterium]MCJ8498561.1 hypothetical protein [Chryseobacterium salipaludis]MCX3297114.1 hypothetical protein [Planobacterium sp. JC490]